MICPHCKKEIEPIEENTSEIIIIKDKEGRLKTWTEVTKDSDGKLTQKRVDEYTYYETGEIDTIMQSVYGPIDSLVIGEREIKHHRDGRRPEVSIIN